MDSAMIGEQSQYYDLDHLLTRNSHFPGEDFEPSVEVGSIILEFFTNSSERC